MFDSKNRVAPQRDVQWTSCAGFGLVCILVIVFFIWNTEPGYHELARLRAEDSYYNLLVQGFRVGQLNVKREAPAGLARLSDPFDSVQNAPFVGDANYPLIDMSYYQGKLYLYFGVTPALVLFWPYVALTGHYLSETAAVGIFLSLGFLTAAILLRAVWRRYFPEVSGWVVAAGTLTLGLTVGTLGAGWLWRSIYEIAQNCGFAFMMLALAAIWGALHNPKRRVLWLLSASLAYGLAIGARPSLLFGGIILLLPVIRAWRAATELNSRRRAGLLLVAAVGPIMLVGLGLMVYNYLRFESPFEFGWHYQLTGSCKQDAPQQFSLRFLWFNLRYYFLEPMRWSGHFPFVKASFPSSWPSGYIGPEKSYGGIILSNSLMWLVLAAPLAWRGRQEEVVSGLRWFMAAIVLLFVTGASAICLFQTASSRYGLDFLPALLLLAVIGILALERAVADSPVWRRIARWGWGLLLAWSIVFNLLASMEPHAEADYFVGNALVNEGRVDEAIEYYQKALALEPESAAFHAGLGSAYYRTKGLDEAAILQYQKALAIDPDYAGAHNNLGYGLLQSGRVNEAITHFQRALVIRPDFAEAHNNLGNGLLQTGRVNEAIAHFQRALELKPDYAEAHNNLGCSLFQAGRVNEAIAHFQRALAIKPDYAEARKNLDYVLHQTGRLNDATVH